MCAGPELALAGEVIAPELLPSLLPEIGLGSAAMMAPAMAPEIGLGSSMMIEPMLAGGGGAAASGNGMLGKMATNLGTSLLSKELQPQTPSPLMNMQNPAAQAAQQAQSGTNAIGGMLNQPQAPGMSGSMFNQPQSGGQQQNPQIAALLRLLMGGGNV